MITRHENDFTYLLRILNKTPDKELVYQSLMKTIKNDEYMNERDKNIMLHTLLKAFEAVKDNEDSTIIL